MNHFLKFVPAYLLCIVILQLGCQKRDAWLDIKSNINSVVPETLKDFQAILEYPATNAFYYTPGLVGSDNITLTDISYLAATEDTRNLYSWSKQMVNNNNYWGTPYRNIEYANIVLDGLTGIKERGPEYNNIKGQALFMRAFSYYTLSQLFCKAFNSETANTDLGVPLKSSSDVNLILPRASVGEVYQKMIGDASEASTLLPNEQMYLNRPISAAAYGLLAKIYLNTSQYQKAKESADRCIASRKNLLDFNNSTLVKPSSEYRFPILGVGNPEILFYAEGGTTIARPITTSTGVVSSELYSSYLDADLRKQIFYASTTSGPKFRGAYTGNFYTFCGIALNEIYLVRSECQARLGATNPALEDLNYLLSHRYKSGAFLPLTAGNADTALELILKERRKELPFVGNQRWEDLKRLNKEFKYQTTLIRKINGVNISLLPNDNRYLLPIPTGELERSGIQQNER